MADLEVMIMPVNRPMPEPIKYRATSLMKSFEEGDHVKVIQVRMGMRAWYFHTVYAEYQSCMVSRGGTRTSRA